MGLWRTASTEIWKVTRPGSCSSSASRWTRLASPRSRAISRTGQWAPKYGSERVVFVPDGLVTLLSAHVAAYPVGPDGWLFTGPTGEPPHQNTVGYWWRKTLRDAGLSGIKLHDLRHFFASGLIAEGCDVVTVQRALGHSKPTTTLNTYAHLWPTAEDCTRKATQSLIDAATAKILADSVRTEST